MISHPAPYLVWLAMVSGSKKSFVKVSTCKVKTGNDDYCHHHHHHFQEKH